MFLTEKFLCFVGYLSSSLQRRLPFNNPILTLTRNNCLGRLVFVSLKDFVFFFSFGVGVYVFIRLAGGIGSYMKLFFFWIPVLKSFDYHWI